MGKICRRFRKASFVERDAFGTQYPDHETVLFEKLADYYLAIKKIVQRPVWSRYRAQY